MDAKPQSNFFRAIDDLKRRKVFRVAAGYGLGAWIFVESSSVVVPALHLPEVLITGAVIIALLGFPAALILSYVFDVTSHGIVRTAATTGEHSQDVRRVSRRGMDFVVIGVLLVVIAYLWSASQFGGGADDDLTSIAVLPFVDLSQSGDSGYFGDGIAEELLNSLAAVDGLRVAARTSSFAFKNSQTNIQTIGEELNVSTVLEGSVRHEGGKIRITAQLIDVDDGFHLWSQTYERDFNDVFEIQDDIANQIVNALRPKLFGNSDVEQISVASSSDVNAWSLYVDGRHFWHQRTEASLKRALELFKQAIEIDPDYAQAYTGLADSYMLLNNYGFMDLDEAEAYAEPAIAEALSLDPNLGEAYASQGLLLMQRNEYDLAELALRMATQLNPSLSMAHMWLGSVLAKSEGLQASYEEYNRAYEIDQLHPVINHNLALTLANMGRFEDAVAKYEQMLRINPARVESMTMYAKIALNHGLIEKAAEMAHAALRLEPDSGAALTTMARIKLVLGDFDAAQSLVDAARRGGMPEEKLAGTVFMLNNSRGDMQGTMQAAMTGLEGLDWRSSNLASHNVLRLIQPGVANVFAGHYQTGVDLLERFFAETEIVQILEPHDQILIASVLALGYNELGRQDDARLRLEQNFEVYNSAIHDGWGDPRIYASMFVNYLALGQSEQAAAELRTAIDNGWSEYWFIAQGPLGEMMKASPEITTMMAELKDNIDSVRDRVELAESAASN